MVVRGWEQDIPGCYVFQVFCTHVFVCVLPDELNLALSFCLM